MPLTNEERNAIKLEVFNAMDALPHNEAFAFPYGGGRIGVLAAHSYFITKPLAFQRQVLLMLAERQVFSYEIGSQSFNYQERCRDTGKNPHLAGTEGLSGEQFLEELRNSTIFQNPEPFRIVFVGLFRTTYAKNWAHWISLSGWGTKNPHQHHIGIFDYEKNHRWHGHDTWWSSLHDFIVGTRSGNNINYGLLPQLWVDAIDALEPQGVTGTILQTKTPPPVYVFSLDTLPDFDKNTFVMVDLLGETPPATFQNLLASKVKSRGKSVVFNALYSQCEREKVERRRILANATTETYKWDNRSYTWTRESEASLGREIIYETKNYLTLTQAMTILNNL
jgi:hypothetical protein